MIGRILGFLAWILMAPPVLGNMLVRSLLLPAPRPPALRSAGLERTGRIAHVLGIVLVVWAAILGYLAVVIGSGLLAGTLVPLGEWARSKISEGFWWVLLTAAVTLVMLFLVSLFLAALAMGTWYGGTQLFRSADAHPLFPTVVGLGMAGVSAAIMVWQLFARGSEPGGAFGLLVLVLVLGPTTAVLLCLIEGVWLLRAPRSVRFRDVYRPV